MIPELLEEFQKTTGKYGERRKWQVASAAAFLWLKLSEDQRDELAAKMWNAAGSAEDTARLMEELSPPAPDRKPKPADDPLSRGHIREADGTMRPVPKRLRPRH